MMDVWKGDWVCRNPRSHRDGSKGTQTVSAPSEDTAREEIKTRASRKLFGISTMKTFIQVTNLENLSKKIS